MKQRNSSKGVVRWIGAALALTFVTLISVFPSAAHMAQGDNGGPQPMIVGGQSTTPGEWPSMVNLRKYGGRWCGGSLLSASWVITAAHCTEGNSASALSVVLGDYNTSSNDGTEQTRNISQIIEHPNYNSTTYDNDIALLKLSQPVTLNSSVKTIRMATTSDSSYYAAGQMSTVTGWGATSEGGWSSSRLLKVSVPFVSQSTCRSSYGSSTITDSMICAGYKEGGRDSCQGDSGGPLMISVGGEWKLAGIVSWGEGCARANKYGVYTRVPNFVSWVNGYVR